MHSTLAETLPRPSGAGVSLSVLSGLWSRLRGKPDTPDAEEVERINDRAPRERFSPNAVGVISNYADTAVQLALYRYLRSAGITSVVYSGPVSILDEPGDLWTLIQDGDVKWVYGQSEPPKFAPELGMLPAGPEEIEVNGIRFTHFARSPAGEERIRFGSLQWPPPGRGQREAVEATVGGTDRRLTVIGSGLEYERWVPNPVTKRWELYEQNVPGYAETPIARIELAPEQRHVIVHPTSRTSYCSVIDPDQNRMSLLML